MSATISKTEAESDSAALLRKHEPLTRDKLAEHPELAEALWKHRQAATTGKTIFDLWCTLASFEHRNVTLSDVWTYCGYHVDSCSEPPKSHRSLDMLRRIEFANQ